MDTEPVATFAPAAVDALSDGLRLVGAEDLHAGGLPQQGDRVSVLEVSGESSVWLVVGAHGPAESRYFTLLPQTR